MNFIVKSSFILILGLLVYNTVVAQKATIVRNDTSVYYLRTSGYIESRIDNADFLLMILPPDTNVDKRLFVIKEFYPDGKIRYISGSKKNKLQAMYPDVPGFYKPILQGTYISFFHNGHKMKVCNYENGDPIGDQTEYYPNGKLYTIKTNTKNKKLLFNECRDSTEKVLVENGNGKWVNFINENFKDYVEGDVINGLEEGEWHGKQDDTVSIVWVYKGGELKSSRFIDKSGQETYIRVEVVPEFPGGINGFMQFLMHNVRYPAEARERNIQGRVIVSFVVEKDGTLADVEVSKSVGGGVDEEAIRVIKSCPPWKPGTQDGKPVRVAYSVPISFTLGGEMTSKDLLHLIDKNN